jgi:hypothetical protein
MVKRKTVIVSYMIVIMVFATFQNNLWHLIISSADEQGNNMERTGCPAFTLSTNLQNITVKQVVFDRSKDWIVLYHVQKTGGTRFDQDLMKNLLIFNETARKFENMCPSIPIKQRNGQIFKYYKPTSPPKCHRPNTPNNESYYLSWHSDLGWRCGLHPELSDFRSCVYKNYTKTDYASKETNFYIISLLREPVVRFLSEFSKKKIF